MHLVGIRVREVLEGMFLPLAITLLLGVFLYALSFNKTQDDARSLSAKVTQQEQEVERLWSENVRLYQEIRAMPTSRELWEQRKRERLGKIRPEETVVVVPIPRQSR